MSAVIRVLLVEDDEPYARLVREHLRDQHEIQLVATAATLGEAIDTATRDKPDVVMLDLGLPDSEGVSTIAAFHEAHARIPIIVLSGLDSIPVAIEAMRFGAQEYLVKGQGEKLLLPRVVHSAIERKRLQELEQLLVGVVSHDLRGPLQTISLTCEVVSPMVDAPIRQRLARALAASRRAEGLVNDLLDATRARLGGFLPITATWLDLVPLVQAIAHDHATVTRRSIELAAPPSLRAHVDGPRIAQVVGNLLGNATQHSAPGSTISVSIAVADRNIIIEVRNDGPPIPEDLRGRLFEPLERAQVGSEHHSIGLGLYIVSEIVKSHEGTIEVSSTSEHGTSFKIVLPMRVS